MPKYARFATGIGMRIVRGEWKVGEQIPPVAQLQREYSLNRVTILKALRHLETEGYLSVEQGRGTFVKRARVKPYVGIFLGDDIFDQRHSPFSTLLARAAQSFFEPRGNELKFYIEHKHLLDEGVLDRDLVAHLERGVLRGLITAGSNAPLVIQRTRLLDKHPVPWVDISVHEIARHRVASDRLAMMRLGLDYIHQQQRRRVAVLGLGQDTVMNERPDFEVLLRERGMTTQSGWLPPQNQFSEEQGYRDMGRLWEGADKPDALLILDDVMGKGAVQAMGRLGIEVPRDLVVICHANKGSNIFYPIAMPKIEYDPEQLITRAGAMLLELMDNPELPPRTVLVRPVLRLPESVEETRVFTPVGMTG